MSSRILVIDDDKSFLEVMRFQLAEEGYRVDTADDPGAGLGLFRKQSYPIVVTDMKMPGIDGIRLIEEFRSIDKQVLVIVITAFGDMRTAIEAMRAGAYDFLPKPCERDHFKHTVRKAVEYARLSQEFEELKKKIGSEDKNIVYQSPKMAKLIALTDRVAASEATILIFGESGTGKELLARRIHQQSPRNKQTFVAINCGAIPKDLLEDELFGHVKGAFTGAVRDRKGRFLQADGGTIFLDEVGELPMELQTRLLRVLQERIVDAVGKDEPIPVDIRIIAATNQNLDQKVKMNCFRQDLFYRLNVVPLTIPPLRERSEDILPLLIHFLGKYSNCTDWTITPEAARRLELMPWPGNIRELENLCQRIALMSNDRIVTLDHLPALEKSERPTINEFSVQLPSEGLSLREIETMIFTKALEMNGFNRSQAAKFLRIPRHILLYRMEKYGIGITLKKP